MLQPKIIPMLVRTILKNTIAYNTDSPPDPPSTQRYFILLAESDDMHFTTSSVITVANDFELTFTFQTTSTLTQYIFEGASNNYLRMAAGAFRFRINDGSSSSTVQTPLTYNDGKLHTGGVKVQSGVQTISIDGVVVDTESSPVTHVDLDIDMFGMLGPSTGPWDGVLANISLDNITEDEQYNWPISNETSNTEVSNGITLTYVDIPAAVSNRENYEYSSDEPQWNNISADPQQLPAVLEIA